MKCIYILLKNLLYTQISSKWAYIHPDKLVTHNIRPFYFLIFVRFADFINCQIVKWLKSPNGANRVIAGLTVAVLIATAEILVPRVVAVELRRTPIDVIRKTTKSKQFHCIKFIQLILTWKIPVGVSSSFISDELGGLRGVWVKLELTVRSALKHLTHWFSMGYFMSVAECVANGFFLPYFIISLDQV